MQQPPYYQPQQPQQPPQFTQYPPQQPYYAPPPPRKKRGKGWLIASVIAAIAIFACIGASAVASQNNTKSVTSTSIGVTTSGSVTTQTPTKPLEWQTTNTFTGNGTKKTEIFTVGNDWKLSWTCNPASFYNAQYNVMVTVMGTDNSTIDLAVNTLCSDSNKSGSTEEHQAGQVYLSIDSEAAWTITIQQLK